MKISVNSTFSYFKFNLNYGSILQCYALQKYLRERQHEVTLVRDYHANPLPVIRTMLKEVLKPKAFLMKSKAHYSMQKFLRKNIRLSRRAYFSYKGLVDNPPKVDCHIVGSDQVWNNTKKSSYLQYVSDKSMKISYAASFGNNDISDRKKEEIRPYLESFSGISVREKSGVDILRNMGFESECLLDPTLLLDKNDYITNFEKHSDKYIMCYILNIENKEDMFYKSIKDYCYEKNLNIKICPPMNLELFDLSELCFPSVEEWLSLFNDAKYIIINSYHGLLFAIIFEKKFVCINQVGDNQAQNVRFKSLLEMLDLEDRLITPGIDNANKMKEILEKEIDYSRVKKIISEKRLETNEFFKRFGI